MLFVNALYFNECYIDFYYVRLRLTIFSARVSLSARRSAPRLFIALLIQIPKNPLYTGDNTYYINYSNRNNSGKKVFKKNKMLVINGFLPI